MLDGVEYIIYKETYKMGTFDENSYYMGRDSRRYGGVAGAGLGLGTAGTALGIFNAMANACNGNGLFGGWFGGGCNRGWNNCGNGYGYNNQNFDMAVSEALAQKDSRIAQLEAEKYADNVGLGIYKYFDGELKEIRATICEQKVFNATVNGAIGTIGSQIGDLNRTVAGITRTAVPSDAICDFNTHSGNCTTCQRQTQ